MTDEQAIKEFYFGSREYNLITFNDYTLGSSGTWGAIAVGGTFTETTASKANFLEEGYAQNRIKGIPGRSSTSDPSVLFNGAVKFGGTSGVVAEVGAGSVALNKNTVPGYWSGSRYYIGASSVSDSAKQIQAAGFVDLSTTSSVVNFASLRSTLTAAQAELAKHSTSLTGTEYSKSGSNITINATGNGVDFLDITASALNSTNDLGITVSKGNLLVINLHVDADNLSLGNFKIDSGATLASSHFFTNTTANRLIWNIIFDSNGINTLTIDHQTGDQVLWGSILSTTGSIITKDLVAGQVISNNFTNTQTELHMALLETDIPEPSTIALVIGSLSLGFVYYRRRQRKM